MAIFLAKIKNNKDRDVVKYIEFNGFECDHYFGGLHIEGACFSGFEKELREIIENDFDALETILTRNEFMHLFELDDELNALGYGIQRNSEKYNRGLEILEEYNKTIGTRLKSDENKQLFQKVIADEKEFIQEDYNLSSEEVDEIFDNYNLEYQDRAIINTIYDSFDEMVEEEKFAFGYEDIPYFDNDAFGKDLLSYGEHFLELESGRIVSYAL